MQIAGLLPDVGRVRAGQHLQLLKHHAHLRNVVHVLRQAEVADAEGLVFHAVRQTHPERLPVVRIVPARTAPLLRVDSPVLPLPSGPHLLLPGDHRDDLHQPRLTIKSNGEAFVRGRPGHLQAVLQTAPDDNQV